MWYHTVFFFVFLISLSIILCPRCIHIAGNGKKNFFFMAELYSEQISRSVLSDSLWHHESQHARPPCPTPTPRVHSDSHPSSQWCHPAISSSVVPFSFFPQSLPASESLILGKNPLGQEQTLHHPILATGSLTKGISSLNKKTGCTTLHLSQMNENYKVLKGVFC